MVLAANRFGAAADLQRELVSSQPDLLAKFGRSAPDMFPRIAEMEEVAAFAGEDPAAR